MNSKACKRLRKLALEISLANGFPEHRYLGRKVTKFIGALSYERLVIINDPKSTRGIYLALKKQRAEVL